LPPETIQAVVRARFDGIRACYEDGLSRNPNLTGRVAVRFIIEPDGQVSSVQIAGSDLPDKYVTACVASYFYAMSFPEPEGHGNVTVVYPLQFSPWSQPVQPTATHPGAPHSSSPPP
jgi:Ca-activated chloride channel family protein